MKKSYLFKMIILSTFLVSFLVIAGCSGGGGDAALGVVTSALTKTIAFSSGGGGSTSIPFANSSAGTRVMFLYRAQEIKGSGTIKSISFVYLDGTWPASSCPHTTIKMSHSNLTVVDATYDNNINTGQGSQVTVLDDATVNIPAQTSAGDKYYTIPLTTPFNYNGVDNLLVEVSRTAACTADIQTLVFFTPYESLSWSGLASKILPGTKFNLSGGDSSISSTDCGTAGCTNMAPFGTPTKMQLLYTAAEINGSGIITSIGFPVATFSRSGTIGGASATMTVKLGHTSLSALTNTFADNFNSGTPVTVANAITFNIPAGIPDGAYVWIPLPDGAFNYNGTDNLVVQIETSAIFNSVALIYYSSVNNTRLDGDPGDTTATPDNAHYFCKFRFAGGPVDVITSDNSSEEVFTYNVSGGAIRQMLYRSAELGAKGTITKFAHRLQNDGSNGTYDTLIVKLANTDLTTLGTTFSTNMPSSTTVYSGTYSISSTSKAGDWIEIPLSTPFTLDPTKNLLMEISYHSGNAHNQNRGSLDATRYPSRQAYAYNYTTDAATVGNFLADLQLIMQ